MHNGGVFLRCTRRVKDGKEHRYWSIVENRRGASQRVVQRQVLYLGEINDSQKGDRTKHGAGTMQHPGLCFIKARLSLTAQYYLGSVLPS